MLQCKLLYHFLPSLKKKNDTVTGKLKIFPTCYLSDFSLALTAYLCLRSSLFSLHSFLCAALTTVQSLQRAPSASPSPNNLRLLRQARCLDYLTARHAFFLSFLLKTVLPAEGSRRGMQHKVWTRLQVQPHFKKTVIFMLKYCQIAAVNSCESQNRLLLFLLSAAPLQGLPQRISHSCH